MDDLNQRRQEINVALRKKMRQRRSAVDQQQRIICGEQAASNGVDWLKQALDDLSDLRIGVFLALKEEIDTDPLIAQLWQHKVRLYLPFAHQRNAPLHWQPYYPDTLLIQDALAILAPEDCAETRCMGMALDAVVVPLVAWDRCGYRIGMGGGFYDRTFAAKIAGVPPFLLGYTYACQECVAGIHPQPWDVGLDGVVNESEILFFTGD